MGYLPGPRGGGVTGQVIPPILNRMTHTCKNITLAKTSFRPVKISPGHVFVMTLDIIILVRF